MSSERASSGDAAGSAERPLTFVGTTDICHRLASVGRGGRRRSIPPARTPPSRHRDARTGGRAGHSGGAQRAAPRLNRMDTLRIADERRWLEPRTCGRCAIAQRRFPRASSGTNDCGRVRDVERHLGPRPRSIAFWPATRATPTSCRDVSTREDIGARRGGCLLDEGDGTLASRRTVARPNVVGARRRRIDRIRGSPGGGRTAPRRCPCSFGGGPLTASLRSA